MKKLMIGVAIVCIAAFAHASNYAWGNGSYSIDNWNGDQAINPDLEAPMYEGGTLFLYLGTIGYDAATGFTGLDTATLLTQGNYDSVNYVYGNPGVDGYSTGDVNKMGGEAYTLILTEGGKSLAELSDGDHFVLRAATSETNYDADLSDNVAIFIDSNPIGAGDWTTYSSVPEPTSGLLLLLGVAGLALKRRRA